MKRAGYILVILGVGCQVVGSKSSTGTVVNYRDWCMIFAIFRLKRLLIYTRAKR